MINDFILWYNDEFKRTRMYSDMANCCEGSPYHREHSVAVHTDMVVMEFLAYLSDRERWTKEVVLGLFAAAFHDVGKPHDRKEKFREDRGTYYSFGGHELTSARLWEDYAVTNWSMLRDRFEFEAIDIYKVGILVEQHKPWDLKDTSKLEALNLTMMMLNLDNTFTSLVQADAYGRMSDDAEEKRAKVESWCEEFENRSFALSGHPILNNKIPTKYDI